MSGYHYQISEASRLLAVEAHVLRYWEEELGMVIPRNEMGHRYYTEEHLRIFSQIKDMKERGYQLRAIRAVLSGEEPAEISEAVTGADTDSGKDKGRICRVRELPIRKDRMEIRAEEHLDMPGKATVSVPEPNQLPPAQKEVIIPAPPEEMPEGGNRIERQNPEKSNPASDQELRMTQFQSMMARIVAQAMLYNNSRLAEDIGVIMEKYMFRELKSMMDSSESRQEERYRKLDESMRAIQQSNRARYEAAASRSPRLFRRRKNNSGKWRI
ncbi:MAG: MerR family transcriptional regulator [Lachnospiraceae bacterium]